MCLFVAFSFERRQCVAPAFSIRGSHIEIEGASRRLRRIPRDADKKV